MINPGAYTHTSIAIRDALQTYSQNNEIVEVHISDINQREQFRKINLILIFVINQLLEGVCRDILKHWSILMNSKKIIAYQGSSGSYSEELLKKEYPDYLYHPTETFTELISYVKSDSGIGLLPVENSIAGTVNEAYEELIDSGLKIFAEYVHRINHSLIGLVGSDMSNITNVIFPPTGITAVQQVYTKA